MQSNIECGPAYAMATIELLPDEEPDRGGRFHGGDERRDEDQDPHRRKHAWDSSASSSTS